MIQVMLLLGGSTESSFVCLSNNYVGLNNKKGANREKWNEPIHMSSHHQQGEPRRSQ